MCEINFSDPYLIAKQLFLRQFSDYLAVSVFQCIFKVMIKSGFDTVSSAPRIYNAFKWKKKDCWSR